MAGPYADFVQLPLKPTTGGGGGRSASTDPLSAASIVASAAQAAEALLAGSATSSTTVPSVHIASEHSAFKLARSVLQEHASWESAKALDAQEREERRGLMRVAVGSGRAFGTTRSKRPPSPSTKNRAVTEVMRETSLTSERCKFFLELKDWNVEEAIRSITDVGASSLLQDDTVELEFVLPNGARPVESFRNSQFGFDIYAKVYQLLEQQDLPFKMSMRGPPLILDKLLDESTWSLSLAGIGMKAGQKYEVTVTQ